MRKFVFYYFILFLMFAFKVSAEGLVINEFSAKNETGISDKDGAIVDWIELYNNSESAINLLGYALSDDPEERDKFILPQTTINAQSYLIIYASGKAIAVPGNEIHTNFKLDANGEYLALSDPSGNILSEFNPYPSMGGDESYGTYNDSYVIFTEVSPGSKNNTISGVKMIAPEFSKQHGFYDNAFDLTISSDLSGVKVYYTTDGSSPTKTNGTLINGAINISKTSVIRAVAYTDNFGYSPVATSSYLFVDDIIHQSNSPAGYPSMWGPMYKYMRGSLAPADYEMDPQLVQNTKTAANIKAGLKSLPVVSLVTNKEHFFNAEESPEIGGIYMYTGPPISNPPNETYEPGRGWERPVSFELFDDKKEHSLQIDCAVEIHGGHSRYPAKTPKHSLKLTFKDEYGPTKLNYPIYGDNKEDVHNSITLKAGFGNSWLHNGSESLLEQFVRDRWTHEAMRNMGNPASNGIFVHLFINGIYWGVYTSLERIDAYFAESYIGGEYEDFDIIKDYSEAIAGTDENWNQLQNYANAGLTNMTTYMRIQGKNLDGSINPNFKPLVDMDNLIDYMILNFYGSNTDWDHHNWGAVYNRENPGKGFQFLVWDSEQMLKSVDGNVLSEDNRGCPSNIFQALIRNTDFRQRFMNRVQKQCYNDGPLTPVNAAKLYDDLIGIVDTAMYAESARWGDYRRDVLPWSPPSGGYRLFTVENDFVPLYEWMMNTYFPGRRDAFIRSLKQNGWYSNIMAPELELNGTPIAGSTIETGDQLDMNVSSGLIYYTLDGTDPRLSDVTSEANANTFELVATTALKYVTIPKSDIGNNWKSSVSAVSDWHQVSGNPGGIGYETGSGYENFISYDVLSEMRNNYSSCYVKIPFEISADQLEKIASLELGLLFDDGFVAYINGTEVQRFNASGSVSWNTLASENHEAGNYESFTISNVSNLLHEGENILAIHALNVSLGSSDFIINAKLSGVEEQKFSGLAETAKQYTGTINLENSIHVMARAYNNNEWSALTEKILVNNADYDGIKITEIHYHPESIAGDSTTDFEFVELKNTSSHAIYLSGAYFSEGIDFSFPEGSQIKPGEFIVLTDNSADFFTHYGFDAYDNYAGQLNNDGEDVVLLSNSNDTICTAKFNDGIEWPQKADGGGYSLVTALASPTNDPRKVADWVLSAEINGSPGADDANSIVSAKEITVNEEQINVSVFPNPMNNFAQFRANNGEEIKLIKIYNLSGEKVVSINNYAGNKAQLVWNGTNSDGKEVQNGIYIYQTILGSSKVKSITGKILKR